MSDDGHCDYFFLPNRLGFDKLREGSVEGAFSRQAQSSQLSPTLSVWWLTKVVERGDRELFTSIRPESQALTDN